MVRLPARAPPMTTSTVCPARAPRPLTSTLISRPAASTVARPPAVGKAVLPARRSDCSAGCARRAMPAPAAAARVMAWLGSLNSRASTVVAATSRFNSKIAISKILLFISFPFSFRRFRAAQRL